MTISPYFYHITAENEQTLVNDLSIECIQMKGLDFEYIPRDSSSVDDLFGEVARETFTESSTIEMYCQNQTGFGGEGDFFSKFGLDVRDESTFQVSKIRFTEVVTAKYPEIIRPREGDLIFYEIAKTVFEISHVEDEKPFYNRGIQTVWELTCKTFDYNNDAMESGITEVDKIDDDLIDVFDDSANIQTEGDLTMNFDEGDIFSENNY